MASTALPQQYNTSKFSGRGVSLYSLITRQLLANSTIKAILNSEHVQHHKSSLPCWKFKVGVAVNSKFPPPPQQDSARLPQIIV